MRYLYRYLKFARMALTISSFATIGVLLWPGALAAVVSFPIFGFSLSTLVGGGLMAQAAGVAVLIFAGIHLLGLAIDATVLAFKGLFHLFTHCFFVSSNEKPGQSDHAQPDLKAHLNSPQSYQSMKKNMILEENIQSTIYPPQSMIYQPIFQEYKKPPEYLDSDDHPNYEKIPI